MSAEQLSPAQLATAAEHLTAAKMFSLASCVMLFYDIAITFGDEVEKIWKQRFTGATVLWFLNRYLSPLGYIVIIVSFNDPSWGKAACQRYVLYPEILKIFTATAVGLIFILRLYSIYSKRSIILYAFGGLLVAELAVKIWAFTDGVMLQLPPGFVGCILTGRSSPGDRIIYTWVAELVFDSAVFFATLYRTITLYRRTLIGEALSLITVIMRDGIMYFAAIFVSNLVTVLIFIFAPQPDLKVINASFSTLITSLMVSRLMLNLRSEVMKRGPVMRSRSSGGRAAMEESYQMTDTIGAPSGKLAFESSIIGNLGAPVITFERSGYEDEYDLYDDDMDDGLYDADVSDSKYPDTSASEDAHRAERASSTPGGGTRLAKKSSLTATLAQTHPIPKFLARRRPRTAEGRMSNEQHGDAQDNVDHTRSLPGQLVVQVTEEVVVVDEAPEPTRALPASPRSHSSSRSLSSPSLPRSPLSPHIYTPPSPPSPRSPRSPPTAYPSRPPHSAGAVYPPQSPHAPDSPTAPRSPGSPLSPDGDESRPSRPPRPTHALRRSWIAPPSWRLSFDKDRDARRPGELS
ncbi:hypothetical protein PYCCODRAFT_1381033 [Trametes coccinea BRFM310]|uniref:DUF6533 domain-containing protein n=1 Tax=Trametes coccinea (strain BRFM310) TaxID=1353009 RepID=A0A1Y2J388_TRAC3|nr:hypothetical protein PYCCODRAFT_1381033 [Trametes coccinea BRFM310]